MSTLVYREAHALELLATDVKGYYLYLVACVPRLARDGCVRERLVLGVCGDDVDTGETPVVVGPDVSGGCVPGGVRVVDEQDEPSVVSVGETKLERNRRWRREKKEKKKNRKLKELADVVKKWPAEKVVKERMGYFSECPEEVQVELRKTRAEMMIAKNKRDTLVMQRKTRELESSVQLVVDTLKVLQVQGRIERQRKKGLDARVGGWATTVVSNEGVAMVERAASKPGSSVPSLESVVPLDSVSEDESQDSIRLMEYKLRARMLEEEQELRGVYVPGQLEREQLVLKEEYADVCYSEREAEALRVRRVLIDKFGVKGEAYVHELLVDLGFQGLFENDV